MFAVLYQTGKQISIPSWDLQYYVSSVSSFKLPGRPSLLKKFTETFTTSLLSFFKPKRL